jgi:hypothetical protein
VRLDKLANDPFLLLFFELLGLSYVEENVTHVNRAGWIDFRKCDGLFPACS